MVYPLASMVITWAIVIRVPLMVSSPPTRSGRDSRYLYCIVDA